MTNPKMWYPIKSNANSAMFAKRQGN
jgi:hypothetical protein